MNTKIKALFSLTFVGVLFCLTFKNFDGNENVSNKVYIKQVADNQVKMGGNIVTEPQHVIVLPLHTFPPEIIVINPGNPTESTN